MAFDNPTQDLGDLLKGINQHQREQEADSAHVRNELLLAGGFVAAGAAIWATHGMMGEGIARLANEERFFGRTGLKVADRLGSNTASLKLADFFGQRGELDTAEKFLMRASNRGSGEAQYRISQMALKGSTTEPALMDKFWDYTKFAAHNGHPGAQLNYAYKLGSEVDAAALNLGSNSTNDVLAFKYLSHAANAKYPRAMAELGKVFEAGNEAAGVTANADRAEELYRAAAEQGDHVGESQLERFLSHKPLSSADWEFSFDHKMPSARALESEVQATALPTDVADPDLLQRIKDTANNKVLGGAGKIHLGEDGRALVPPTKSVRDAALKEAIGSQT